MFGLILQIERTLFEDTVKTLNNYYAEAEKISGQSYLEGCLACVSAYIIFLCMETRYEKVLYWDVLLSTFYIIICIYNLSAQVLTHSRALMKMKPQFTMFLKRLNSGLTFLLIQVWPCMYSEGQTEIVLKAIQKMFWCLMCPDPPCLQIHQFTYKFTGWLHAEVIAPVYQWLHLNFWVPYHGWL